MHGNKKSVLRGTKSHGCGTHQHFLYMHSLDLYPVTGEAVVGGGGVIVSDRVLNGSYFTNGARPKERMERDV